MMRCFNVENDNAKNNRKPKDNFLFVFWILKKASDKVRYELMMERLIEFGVDMVNLRVLSDLYWEEKTVVRIGEEKSGWMRIEGDV